GAISGATPSDDGAEHVGVLHSLGTFHLIERDRLPDEP
ncbi:MAG: hypothetical protein QOK43_1597, partial [Acidimicrobiaceae bacterium]|nr:hypothetical protein [Acidimicrobiaceae bacterium]